MSKKSEKERLSLIAHDLMIPVTVIDGLAQLHLDIEEKEEGVKQIQLIKKNAERLHNMIECLKIESMENLPLEKVNLNDVFRGCIEGFKPKLDEKKMKLKYNARPDLEYTIHANMLVGSVFDNLLFNAIKYSPEGSLIECGIEDGNGSWIPYVKDWGIGIQDKSKLFKKYSRLSDIKEGSGLGLVSVKKIVESHKGKVYVEDNPEGGSIFYVELPKYSAYQNAIC